MYKVIKSLFNIQVRATPSIPQEEVMSIVELPPAELPNEIGATVEPSGVVAEAVNKKSEMKNKRKLTETPSMVDPDLVSKKPVATTPVPMEISDTTTSEPKTPKSGRTTPKVHKKRKEGSQTPVNDLVPEMTPEIQRKPPKPKHSEDEQPPPPTPTSEKQAKMKRRVSRKERARDVKTPDPSFAPMPEDDHMKHAPTSRPSTPRQARAPSPEERPLVVPLPPPRIQDPSPQRVAPVTATEPMPPALPPRPVSATPKSQEPQQTPPPPPPRIQSQAEKEPMVQLAKKSVVGTSSDEDKLKQRMIEEEKRFAKQLESTIPADRVQVMTLNQPEHEVKPLIMKDLPSLAQAKEAFRNSGIFPSAAVMESTHPITEVMPDKKPLVNKAFEQIEPPAQQPKVSIPSLTRQEQAEDMKMEEIGLTQQQINNTAAVQIVSPKQIQDSVVAAENSVVLHQNKNLGEQVTTAATTIGNLPNTSEAMRQSSRRNEEIPQGNSKEVGAIHVLQQELKTVPDTTIATSTPTATSLMTQAASKSVQSAAITSAERLKDTTNECNESEIKNSNNADDASRSLINSMPKPFKVNIPQENSTEQETKLQLEILTSGQEEIEAKIKDVSPKLEQSKTETATPPPISNSNSSHSPSPAQNSQSSSQNQSPQPSLLHLLHRPEKRDNRDSKVIKAAAYWNTFIGEVMDKKKPPDNVKSLEKPKKIVSAGVGPRGMENLKSAFEQNKLNQNVEEQSNVSNNSNGAMQRRNSRKMAPVEGCVPGLKVTDAKSVFEIKAQQTPTPVLYRRNSSMSGDSTVKMRGKESDADDQGQSSNGPNYIKKKVPDFPPPPVSSKTPFGAAQRRQGALSPRTVPMTAVDDIRNITKSPISPEASTELKTPKFSKQSQLSIDSLESNKSEVKQPQTINKSEVKPPQSVNKSEVKPPQTIKISVQEKEASSTSPISENNFSHNNRPHLSPVNGHTTEKEVIIVPNNEVSFKTTKTKDVQKSSEHIPLKTEDNNKKPSELTNNTSIGPVLTIKSISREEGVIATVAPSEEKKSPVAKKEVIKDSINTSPVVVANHQKALKAEPKANDSKSNQTNHQKILKPESSLDEVANLSTKIKDEKKETSKINKASSHEIEDKATLSEKSLIKKETSSKENNMKSANLSNPVTKSTLESVVPDHLDKQKSNIMNTVEPSKVSITAPSYRSIKIDKEEAALAAAGTINNERPQSPEQVSLPLTSGAELEGSRDKPAPLRIIPIQIEQTNNVTKEQAVEDSKLTSPKPLSRQEHHIPIHVEGKGTILNNLEPTNTEDMAETRDSFSTNSLSRRRFGSRKKRASTAYSDSSTMSAMSAEDEATALGEAFSGLQKYTSIGKHGLEPMFRLRKTRPPFATQRSDSFSSGEEDDFDDDGFREMTAENLFSTLLTRVKSLTRRIHDEHDDPSRGFQQNHGIINHRLNPGGTHARLERSALRNSLKRNNSSTPNALSRQSSMDASMRTSLRDDMSSLAGYDDGASSMRSYGSHGGDPIASAGYARSSGGASNNQQRGISSNDSYKLDHSKEGSGALQQQQEQGKEESKRYIDLEIGKTNSAISGSKTDHDSSSLQTNVSVTSKQRLRPGYLPPPSHLASDPSATDSSSHDTRIEHALSESSSFKNLDRIQASASKQTSMRQIPINVEHSSKVSNLSSTSLASGPSQSDIMDTISEKATARKQQHQTIQPKEATSINVRRQSKFLPDEDQPSTKPYLNLAHMQPKSVPLKRLSGNFDLDQDNDNTSSSGYYSSQPHHHTMHASSHRPTSMEGQLTKPLMFDKESTLQPSTTSTASFTASNSSSSIVVSNQPSSTSGPPSSALSAATKITPTISTTVSTPISSTTTKLPLPPSQLPPMNQYQLPTDATRISVVSSSSNTITPTTPTNIPTLSSVPPVTSPRLQQQQQQQSSTIFFPSSPSNKMSNTPSVMSGPVLSSPPMSPPPTLRGNAIIKPKLVESPTQKLLLQQQSENLVEKQQPKLTQPIYTPFKKPEFGSDSKQPTSPVSPSNENPFQKKVRNQPYRPYLQLALEKDKLHRSQLATKKPDGLMSSTDDNAGEFGSSGKAGGGRRTILPYGGAKSDGLLNKHAFISSNVIAAAERRKRDSYSRSSTTELLPMEKVIDHLVVDISLLA